ncbi:MULTISPECIES: methyltransferase family protein [Nocardiaceae]|uniref:methyltransferase family protein n=1 Tax=Nocardiaceae TaxID=85025 RepID=UPI0012D316C2|nr:MULTISPECIES: hypothetical protein [Rhodococcus]MBJ7322474.1 hypothetical protein [Rhodococcus sp. (in: high G+C Gram-positive bacteria)]MDJ0467512.1 hypothetical protein [Rhodococcus fascians]
MIHRADIATLDHGVGGSPAMVAFLAGGYVRRIPSEEKAMLEGLGDAYADYMARSKRLVPFVF